MSSDSLVKFNSLMAEINKDNDFNVGLVPEKLGGTDNWTQRVEVLLAQNGEMTVGKSETEVGNNGGKKYHSVEEKDGGKNDDSDENQAESENSDDAPEHNGGKNDDSHENHAESEDNDDAPVIGGDDNITGEDEGVFEGNKVDDKGVRIVKDGMGQEDGMDENVGGTRENDTVVKCGGVRNVRKIADGVAEEDSNSDEKTSTVVNKGKELADDEKAVAIVKEEDVFDTKNEKDVNIVNGGDDQTEHIVLKFEKTRNRKGENRESSGENTVQGGSSKCVDEKYEAVSPNMLEVDFDYINEFVNQIPTTIRAMEVLDQTEVSCDSANVQIEKVPEMPINDEYLIQNINACLENGRALFKDFAEKLDHIDSEALGDWILNKHNNVAALFKTQLGEGSIEANARSAFADEINSSSDTITNEKQLARSHAREIMSYESLSMFSPSQTTLNKHDLEDQSNVSEAKRGDHKKKNRRNRSRKHNKENTNILNTPTKTSKPAKDRTPVNRNRNGRDYDESFNQSGLEDSRDERSFLRGSNMPKRDLVVYDEMDIFSPTANHLDEYEIDYIGQDDHLEIDKNSRHSSQESLHHNDSLDIKLRKKLKGNRLQRGQKRLPRSQPLSADQCDGNSCKLNAGDDGTPVGKTNNTTNLQDLFRENSRGSPNSNSKGPLHRKLSNDDTDFQISWANNASQMGRRTTNKARQNFRNGYKQSVQSELKSSGAQNPDKHLTANELHTPAINSVEVASNSINQAYEANFSKLDDMSTLDLSQHNKENTVFLPNSSSEEENNYYSPADNRYREENLASGSDEFEGNSSDAENDEVAFSEGSSMNSSCIDLHCEDLGATEHAEDYKRYRAAQQQGILAGSQLKSANGISSNKDLNFKGWMRDMDLYNVSTNVNVSDDDGLDESYNVLKTPTPLKEPPNQGGIHGRPGIRTSFFAARRVSSGDELLRKAVLRNDFLKKRQVVDYNVNLWRMESHGHSPMGDPFASGMSNSFNFDADFSNLPQGKRSHRIGTKAVPHVNAPNVYEGECLSLQPYGYSPVPQSDQYYGYYGDCDSSFSHRRKHRAVSSHHFYSSSPQSRKHCEKPTQSVRSEYTPHNANWSPLAKQHPQGRDRNVKKSRSYNSSVFDARQILNAKRFEKQRKARKSNLDESIDGTVNATYAEQADHNDTYEIETYSEAHDDEALLTRSQVGYEGSDSETDIGENEDVNEEIEFGNEEGENISDDNKYLTGDVEEFNDHDNEDYCQCGDHDDVELSNVSYCSDCHEPVENSNENSNANSSTQSCERSAPHSEESSYKSISLDAYSIIEEDPSLDVSWRSATSQVETSCKIQRKTGPKKGIANQRAGTNRQQKTGKNMGKNGKANGTTDKEAMRNGSFKNSKGKKGYQRRDQDGPIPGAWTKANVEEFESRYNGVTIYNNENDDDLEEYNENESEHYEETNALRKAVDNYSKRTGSKHGTVEGTERRNSQVIYRTVQDSHVNPNVAKTRRRFSFLPIGHPSSSNLQQGSQTRNSRQFSEHYQNQEKSLKKLPDKGESRSDHWRRDLRSQAVSSANETFDIVNETEDQDLDDDLLRERYRKTLAKHIAKDQLVKIDIDKNRLNRMSSKPSHNQGQTYFRYRRNSSSSAQTFNVDSTSERSYSINDSSLYENGLTHDPRHCPYENVLRAHPAYYPGLDISRMRRAMDRQRSFMEAYLCQMSLYRNVARSVANDSRFDFR